MKTVFQVCAYRAEYAGNFIASLTALEQDLNKKGIAVIYGFPELARGKDWCAEIEKRTKVYYLPEAKARILPSTYMRFRRIFKENDICIVHSHFELYDMPAALTAPKNVKVFWHLHDPIALTGNVRDILWRVQYGHVGKRAVLLAVADHYRKFAVSLGFPEEQTTVVLNGINLDRVRPAENTVKKYQFLTFGWDFARKGDDLILRACDRLERDGYQFRLLLNGNESTWGPLDEFLQGRSPVWLERGNPVEDVSELFGQSEVFVQASRKETFSYAVCEAAYAGLPVISSDIPGLEWAHDLPSVTFFPNEDADALYQQMKAFLDGREISSEAIAETGERIRERYSLENWAKEIMALYQL